MLLVKAGQAPALSPKFDEMVSQVKGAKRLDTVIRTVPRKLGYQPPCQKTEFDSSKLVSLNDATVI